MMHGANPYPIFRAGDRKRQVRGLRGGAAEPHALKRPLDRPARAGQACRNSALLVDGVDQQRSGFRLNDRIDHGEGIIRAAGE